MITLATTDLEIAVCLPFAADLIAQAGDLYKAATLLALGFRYPVVAEGWIGDLPEILALQQTLKHNLPPADFANAWAQGQALDLQATAKTVMDDIMMDHEQHLQTTRQLWDKAAATFDNEPDHGLRDPLVRKAWCEQLQRWLPPQPAAVLDIGCGTGSLSLLMAALGHQVTAIDLSPAMIAQAAAKARAAGQAITFGVMDAADPQLGPQRFDLILCRHLLWALPNPAGVLHRWVDLLWPGGRLVLIEGFWHTGAGLHAQEVVAALPSSLRNHAVQPLNDQTALWGGPVTDERYAIIADSGTKTHHKGGIEGE